MIIWFTLGIVLILLELVTPTFISMFFGFGALGASFIAYVYPGIQQELIAFIAVTAISLVVLRTKMKNIFQGFQKGGHDQSTMVKFAYLGKEAVVSKDISPQREGEVSVGGSYWRATADVFIPKDMVVIIDSQDTEDHLLLIVKPHN